MQFPVKGKKNEYFLIFTTTPWTIPANVAIAFNEGIDYAKVKQGDKYYWLAESRLSELKGEYKVAEKKKGRELEGMKYEMPYKDLLPQKNSPHKVVLWELASGEEGTGIVHIAPGCGAEDYELGKRLGLPAISPLDESGTYLGNFGEFSNKKYSKVNQEVLEDLEKRGFIYKVEPYKHRYPHCWRCGEELVFRLVDEWYVKCDEIREKLIKENKKIEWFPEYGKTRQEDWFKNMSDWLISRKRYWGLPLPIWECSCGNIEVIGSLKELREKAVDKKKVDSLPEIHRPWVDDIKIKCRKCGKDVKRIPDVGDAWLDAGIVPFSTIGPYLEKKEEWKKWFPADFICENMPGQYRGWFNALMWASVTLAEKAPFKSILGYETVKDEKGEEMHKSKGNAIWAKEALDKIGADPLRMVFCLHDPDKELWFGWNTPKDATRALNVLWNISQLLIESKKIKKSKIEKIEDRWIISKLNTTIKKATENFENLKPSIATGQIYNFWLEELSRQYIQFVRDRLSEGDEEAYATLYEAYINLLKLCAPIIPFITESLYQKLKEKFKLEEESIHLSKWPKADEKKIDEKLEKEMKIAQEIMTVILAEREKAKIGLRWPLQSAEVRSKGEIRKELVELMQRQANIRQINLQTGDVNDAALNTEMTPELEAEGYMREIARKIQAARKKAGLNKENHIYLLVQADAALIEMLKKQENDLADKVNAISVRFADLKEKSKEYKTTEEDKIKDKQIRISFDVYSSAK